MEVTEEMLSSKEKDTLLKCISAGMLPEVLQREDVEFEVVKRRAQGSNLYLDKCYEIFQCLVLCDGGVDLFQISHQRVQGAYLDGMVSLPSKLKSSPLFAETVTV